MKNGKTSHQIPTTRIIFSANYTLICLIAYSIQKSEIDVQLYNYYNSLMIAAQLKSRLNYYSFRPTTKHSALCGRSKVIELLENNSFYIYFISEAITNVLCSDYLCVWMCRCTSSSIYNTLRSDYYCSAMG